MYIDEEEIKGAVLGNCEQYYNGIHFYLKEMFVTTDSQGMSIGSKMLKALEEQLKGMGVSSIYLLTSKGNRTSKFYEKNEFNEWNSMVMMGKKRV